MSQKVSKILPLTRDLLDQSRDILGQRRLDVVMELDKFTPNMDDMYLIFLHVHMKIALSLGYGAYYSCYHGWGIGGVGAARSVYEIFVTVEYIKKHRDERLERFIFNTAEARLDDMETLILLGVDTPQNKKKEIGNTYKLYKQKYENATPPYEKHKWAGISIEEMAAKINWEKRHKLVYGQLSQISHVSAKLMDNHVIEMEGNKIRIDSKLHESNEYCVDVLNVVFEYISLILDEFMKAFKIQPSATLERIQKDAEGLYRSFQTKEQSEKAVEG